MKAFPFSILCLLLLPFSLSAEAVPLTAAVLDFQTAPGPLAGKGSEAALLINASLSSSPAAILLERQELEKILSEQELGLGGMVSPDSAAKIGKLTGAKVLVTGRMFEAGGKFFLVAKIMSTETSRVYGETATFSDPGGLDGAATDLASKIGAVLEKKGDTMVAQVEDPGAQIDRLRKLVEGKKLPILSITVAEQHLSRPVIDPAVDTEFKKALMAIGFEVIDAGSGRQPDVRISGEAFSELGARRGNLVACRARAEVTAKQVASDKLLFADRQTDVGVDLSEAVAGKTALQNAAKKLLDRLVPALVN